MYHPMKRLETKWNAHTPKYLHNRTKENFIFQLVLLVLFLLGMYAKDSWEERNVRKARRIQAAIDAQD